MLSFRPSRWRPYRFGRRGLPTLVLAALVAAALGSSAGASPFERRNKNDVEAEVDAPKKKEKKKTKGDVSHALLLEVRKHTVRRARLDALAVVFLEQGAIDKFRYVEQLRAREAARFERERIAYREHLGGRAFDRAIESLRDPRDAVASARPKPASGVPPERDGAVADAREPQQQGPPAAARKPAQNRAKPAGRQGGAAAAQQRERPPAKRVKDAAAGATRGAEQPAEGAERPAKQPAKQRPARVAETETTSQRR